MTFDQKCYVLAEHFLEKTASERHKRGLASAIQSAIEEYLDENGIGEAVNVEAMPC